MSKKTIFLVGIPIAALIGMVLLHPSTKKDTYIDTFQPRLTHKYYIGGVRFWVTTEDLAWSSVVPIGLRQEVRIVRVQPWFGPGPTSRNGHFISEMSTVYQTALERKVPKEILALTMSRLWTAYLDGRSDYVDIRDDRITTYGKRGDVIDVLLCSEIDQ